MPHAPMLFSSNYNSMKCLFNCLFGLALFFAVSVNVASADTHVWDGEGANENWSTCANWDVGNTCPVAGDTVTFNATSTKNCTIDASAVASITTFNLSAGYTGTIAQARAFTVSGVTTFAGAGTFTGSTDALTFSGAYSQSAGIFNAGNQTITFSQPFTLATATFNGAGTLDFNSSFTLNSGAVFISTSGTAYFANAFTIAEGAGANAWQHNNGTVVFDANNTVTLQADSTNTEADETFNNFQLNKSGGALFGVNGEIVNVLGTLTLTDGSWYTAGAILSGQGAVSIVNTFDGGSGTLRIDGSGVNTVTIPSGMPLPAFTLNNANATVDFTGSTSTTFSGVFTLQAGTFNQGSVPLVFSDAFTQSGGTFNGGSTTIDLNSNFTLSGGTFNAPSGNFNVSGSWTHTAGGSFVAGTGTVIADGVYRTWNFNVSETFNNFTFSGTSNPYNLSSDTLITTGLLKFEGNNTCLNTGTLEPHGNVTINTATACSSDLTLSFANNTNAQTFNLTGSTDKFTGPITINKSSGSVDLASALITTGAFTLTSGTFNTSSYNFTTGGTYSQGGGTFNGNNSTINLITFNLSGGTFSASTGTMTVSSTWTHTVGGIFTHNNGTVKSTINFNTVSSWNFNSAETFGNFEVDCNGGSPCTNPWYGPVLASGDNLIVDGTLFLTDGTISYTSSDGGITAKGNVTVGSGWDNTVDGGTPTPVLTFAGTSPQTFDLTGATALFNANIVVNGASTVVNLASALIMDLPSQDLIIQQGTFDLNGSNLTVSGSSTETLIVNNTGKLQLQGGETVTADSASYPQFDLGSTVTYDSIAGSYTIKDWTYTNTTLVINGGASMIFTLGATETIKNVTISSGILSMGGNSLTVTTSFINEATLRLRGNETFTGTIDTDSGTIELVGDADGLADSYGLLSNSAYNLTVNFTDALDVLAPVATTSIGATFLLQNGTFTAPATLNIAGSFNRTGGTFGHNGGTVNLTGTGTVTNTDSFNNLTINSAGTITLGSALDVNGTLTLTAGTLDVSGTNYGINVAGSWTDAGAGIFNEGTGTVTFDGTGTISSNEAFNNVTINTSGTATLGAVLYVSGDLTVTSGTLDVSVTNYGITVGGNFAQGGSFNARTGTVTFNDATKTSIISGSTTFSSFRCVTADKNFQFTAGTTQTINGALVLTGTVNHLIVLRSTSTGVAWMLNIVGGSAVTYVDVKDSDASSGSGIEARNTGSINSGNNLGWSFNVAPTVGISEVAIDGSGYVTITFVVDDSNDDDVLQGLVEYNVGAGWVKATLSEVGGDTTATYGTPDIENDNAYQVGNATGYIITSPGANTLSVKWDSKVDAPTADTGTALVRVTVYDGYDSSTPGVSSNFTIDNADPLGLAGFASSSTTSSTITFAWTAATDTHFGHYEIWYGLVENDVINRTGTASEWDNVDDATLATATTATTTVTGLAENTTYYVKIWAIDTYTNDATLSATTANNNGRPTLSGVLGAESVNANQYITVQFTANDSDLDNTLQALVEYNVGSGWAKATLSEEPSHITATYGTPDVENDGTYQIGNAGGYITTSSGANSLSVIWRADLDVPGIDLDAVTVRVTPFDGIEPGSVVSSTAFIVDAVAPTSPGSFAKVGGTGTTADTTWVVSVERHFNHYEIWYGTNQTDVNNRSGTALEWDNSDDVNLATRISTGTTITGLTPGATYYTKICALDNYGYTTCGTVISFVTNQVPTVSTVIAVQSSLGDSDVTISFIMDDPDNDDTLQAKIEYSLDGGGTWLDPSLSISGSETSASYGDPSINNAVTYQVGQSGAYITSSSGANTVTVVWEALTDIPVGTNIANAKIKITPYDGIASGTASESSAFVLDIVSPVGLTVLMNGSGSSTAVGVLTWNAVTESNFNHYEIWYGDNQSNVQNRNGSALEWDNSDDATLATVSTYTTRIITNPSNKYFKIWAVDQFGNEETVSEIFIVFNHSGGGNIGMPSNVSVASNSSGGALVTWDDPVDDDSSYVSVLRGISPYAVDGMPIATVAIGTEYFIDTGVSAGQTVTYQLRATDGSDTGDLTGLVTFTVPATTTSTTGGTSGGGSGGGGGSGSSSSQTDTSSTAGEEETDVPEEADTDEGEEAPEYSSSESFIENIDLPEHWSTGYMKNLITEEYVVEVAISEISFMDVLTTMLTSPDSGMNRADAVEFLVVLSGMDIGNVTIDTSRPAFTDVSPKFEQAGYIEFAYQAGLIHGYPDGSFRPFKVLNRAEILKMCMYFFGYDADSSLRGGELLGAYGLTKNPFTDVDLDAWYAPYVIKAYYYGIVKGYTDGTFRPGQLVTNAEFLKIATLSQNLEEAVELASELELE